MDKRLGSVEFTAVERDILNHRLDVPCAIADALETEWDREMIVEIVDELKDGKLPYKKFPIKAVNDVLQDAVEGSTWIATMDFGAESHQKISSHVKSGQRLAEKIGELIDRDLRFPAE